MNSFAKNRWQVRGAAVFIFVLGFAAGVLALNAYHGWVARTSPRDRVDQLSEQLQLSADQKAKVRQIFSETREQLRALRKDAEPKVSEIRTLADGKMQQVLTPEQWKQFQTMRDDMRQKRGRGGPRND